MERMIKKTSGVHIITKTTYLYALTTIKLSESISIIITLSHYCPQLSIKLPPKDRLIFSPGTSSFNPCRIPAEFRFSNWLGVSYPTLHSPIRNHSQSLKNYESIHKTCFGFVHHRRENEELDTKGDVKYSVSQPDANINMYDFKFQFIG